MGQNLGPISVAQRLYQHDLFYFTPQLVGDLFELERSRAYRLIARLKAENLIVEVEKGKYLLLGLQPEQALANPLFIACQLATPAYVSYWSALHFYGLTEQTPLITFVATTRKKQPAAFRNFRFRFVTVQPKKFFGYRRERTGGLAILIADEAKSIIDSLDQLRYAGGIGEVAKALRLALEVVEAATLVAYANQMGDKSLCSRLGYLLERLGQATEGLLVSGSPIKLDPARPRNGSYNARWRVVVNAPEAEWQPQGVG